MKNKSAISLALIISAIATQTAYADSTRHFSEAAMHSGLAVGHSVVGTAKLASTIVAVPLVAIGSVGKVSQDAGEGLLDIANQPIGDPLPISNETVSVGPAPSTAIKNNDYDEGEF